MCRVVVAFSIIIRTVHYFSTPEVRFCLSDGQFWVFFILKSKGGTLTFYESVVRRLDPAGLEISDKPLREILLLLSEWVSLLILSLSLMLNFRSFGPLRLICLSWEHKLGENATVSLLTL